MKLDVWLIVVGIVAGIAGVLGFFLSLYTYFTSRLDKRPKLDVDLFQDVIEYKDEEFGSMPPEDMVFLDVTNPGNRRVKVLSKWIEVSRGFLFIRWRKHRRDYPYFMGKSEPYWLPPGDNSTYGTEWRDFQLWLNQQGTSGQVYFRGLVRDATGNWYRSSWDKFDISDL